MTGEELSRCPDLGPCELVEGKVVPRAYATPEQAALVARLGADLEAHLRQTNRGIGAMGRVGVYTRRNPDTVRGADIVVISHERYARCSSTFFDVAPELLVEVQSSLESPGKAMKKIREYLAAGVDRVWYVEPRRRQVRVYRSPEQVETLGMGDVLRDEEILPGFSLTLAELFG
jgi:Uma2 family endonuclease